MTTPICWIAAIAANPNIGMQIKKNGDANDKRPMRLCLLDLRHRLFRPDDCGDVQMIISQIIATLQKEMDQHGDLPCYTADADISRIQITACRDGVSRTVNGVPETPNELYIEFISK